MASSGDVRFGRAVNMWEERTQGPESTFRSTDAWKVSGRTLSEALALLTTDNLDSQTNSETNGSRSQKTNSSNTSLATISSNLLMYDRDSNYCPRTRRSGTPTSRKRASARMSQEEKTKKSIFSCFS